MQEWQQHQQQHLPLLLLLGNRTSSLLWTIRGQVKALKTLQRF